MPENHDLTPVEERLPEAEVERRKGISLIWIVPLVALAIGGWLAYKALSEKGPTIFITFNSAEGLEAGKTKIRYKDVEVGQVEEIRLSQDLTHVVVTASMVKEAEDYLTENAHFWVVRARVAAGEVSGLGTLFSGAYIGIDPGKKGKPTRDFTGLEVPPVVTTEVPGKHFNLIGQSLGSLDVGSPVYFRQIKVGQIVRYQLRDDNRLDLQIFIQSPHADRVRKNSVFWNSSGIDISLDPSGLEINTESMVSILLGGIAFDLPPGAPPGPPAAENVTFDLYPSRQKTTEKTFTKKNYYLLLFENSVRGLVPGAPVEFRGIKVGEVVDINIEFDPEKMKFRIPVLIYFEPERIKIKGGAFPAGWGAEELLEKGFRARLQSGSLITGRLFVDLDIDPMAKPAKLAEVDGYPVLPTVSGTIEEFTETMKRISEKIEKFPLEKIGSNLQETLKTLDQTLQEMQGLGRNLNTEVTPQINNTLVNLQKTLDDLQNSLGTDSALNYNANKAMDEFTTTMRSLRTLTESLERNPQSIIFGKENE
ncbi:paraquat-inducible protein B [Desulfuromonas versatilis]|uniref:Paraquat-inducible protein B n=1 Tax=Desulfuromonas versatilis TaxID=2802975 RepID=A0ABM8HPT0_9BACT|nr:MlaD family protein [Desulfuromonas versatilis]BCR05004.1 paraquat-inducible protein B [Desulfuromonas versatilis]